MSIYLDLDGPLVGGETILVHEFKISDTDEPDLIASMVIADWLDKDRIGQWIYENKIPVQSKIVTKMSMYYPMVEVYAVLTDIQLTEYYLIR